MLKSLSTFFFHAYTSYINRVHAWQVIVYYSSVYGISKKLNLNLKSILRYNMIGPIKFILVVAIGVFMFDEKIQFQQFFAFVLVLSGIQI